VATLQPRCILANFSNFSNSKGYTSATMYSS